MINRPVQLSVTTTGNGFQDLAPFRILFTGDISCKPANSGPVLFQIDGVQVAWDPGEWHTFHHIDLLLIQVSGNAGDIVTCIGDTFAPASAEELKSTMPYTPTTSAPQVVDDPQPQLGGDLDLNGHAITIGGSPMIDAYGNINSNSVSTAGGSAAIRGDGSASFGNSAVQIDSFGQIILSNLPTTDPGNYGQLWNSGGTLKVSS